MKIQSFMFLPILPILLFLGLPAAADDGGGKGGKVKAASPVFVGDEVVTPAGLEVTCQEGTEAIVASSTSQAVVFCAVVDED